MAGEKTFVDALIKSAKHEWPDCVVLKSSDQFTLGIPDILIWGVQIQPRRGVTWALEAKALFPLMEDHRVRGRRTGKMLKHAFSGPQISTLRKLFDNDCQAYGIVRVSNDTALMIRPERLPKSGNFTHEEMLDLGTPVKRVDGIWRFW